MSRVICISLCLICALETLIGFLSLFLFIIWIFSSALVLLWILIFQYIIDSLEVRFILLSDSPWTSASFKAICVSISMFSVSFFLSIISVIVSTPFILTFNNLKVKSISILTGAPVLNSSIWLIIAIAPLYFASKLPSIVTTTSSACGSFFELFTRICEPVF